MGFKGAFAVFCALIVFAIFGVVAASPASASTPRNADGTYSETVGGNANTWTNYTNAGGTQGPTIPGFSTVSIACVVQGFRVADGNTNWYLVASSPWSYRYYVSADAFYNNGQTSGTLHGTPFVDPAVPSCSAGNGGKIETAGGAANTWTNYTNAGGTQGPTIGGGASVSIECKVQGFRVADGNTWWYRIAQSPWNSSFYVSADAFYNNGQTSGSLHGTPFVDPGIPDCSSGGSSAPPGGRAETVGGNANTWTNYANAGGTQGPTIPGGTTVSIACKLSGFRVADGNTWWYQVASAPWNGSYYVSADAFYNNGQTSGSLRGTPFVDSAVPDCVGGSGQATGGQRPGTEIAGGNANTWANYSHAGGKQGPTIPGGTAVSVACRAQGFRVADGNTWWYLVSSAPWNSVYYVSADAFYNNGQTSGSLRGTPFYDPAVPVCVHNVEAPLYFTSVASGRSTSGSPTCTYGHYPINCASGDFWHEFTDVSVGGRGPGLSLTRTYNALDPEPGQLFGYGWSSSYDAHIAKPGPDRADDGTLVITLDDGSQITATPDGSGGYTTPPATDSALVKNGDGTFTLTRHQTALETFSASGQLMSLRDLNGNQTTLHYDGTGHLATVTDSAGRTLTITVSGNGLVSSVSDPMGRTTTYSYDADGNLQAVVKPLGRTWRYTYDSGHRMLTMTDPRGGVVTNTYDDQGRVTKQIDPAGLETGFAYTGDNFGDVGGTTTITDPHGVVRSEQYANGYLTKVIKALGTPREATWTYTYDPDTFGQTSARDPNGHTSRHTYDSHGRVLTVSDGLGNQTTYTYNGLGQPLTTTTPLGEVTTRTYDGKGNLLAETDPRGKTTTYTHGDSSHPEDVTAMTDPDGRTMVTTYDAKGDITSNAISPTPDITLTTSFVYDEDGEKVCEAPANATSAGISCPAAGASRVPGTVTTIYDDAGEPTSVTDAAGHTTTTNYDGNGNPTSVTDPDGNITTTTYDGNNRPLTRESDASATSKSIVHYSYDIAAGSGDCPGAGAYCTTTTDPSGGRTVYAYDELDHLIRSTRPGGKTTSFIVDAVGNRKTRTDASGVETHYGYDDADRLTSTTYPDSTMNVTYRYDADGHRTSMTDGTGTTTSAYDSAGRLTAQTNGDGATIGFEYDGAGNTTAISYPNGHTIYRQYDSADRQVAVTDWMGSKTRFAYDPNGNLITTTYPNGTAVNSEFDASDALTSTSVLKGFESLAGVAYDRDAASLITKETNSGALTGSTNFGYDGRRQLTLASGSTFGYDASGHLKDNNGTAQAFNTADQMTSATNTAGTTTYAYDANGNRITAVPTWGRTVRSSYDAENRLTSVTSSTRGPTVAAVRPSSGPAAGGSMITITGQGFGEATGVTIGGVAASQFTVASDTKITAITGSHAVGSSHVVVSTGAGSSMATSADAYEYTHTTAVTNVMANAGPTRGRNKVTLLGDAFTGAKRVVFRSATASNLKVMSDKKLVVTVPPGTGTVSVQVQGANGEFSATTAAARYSYVDGAVVTGLTPTAGSSSGGAAVTITGAGFTGATQVKFGTVSASRFTVDSGNQITATTPPGSGAAIVTVTTPKGASATVGGLRYKYSAQPTVKDVAPLSGPSNGGNTVTIAGTNFIPGATSVYFGNDLAAVNVISSTSLEVVAPTGTDIEDVRVRTAGGISARTGADQYRFVKPMMNYQYNGDGLRVTKTGNSGAAQFIWDTNGPIPHVVQDAEYDYVYGPDGLPIEQVDSGGHASYFFRDANGSTRALLDQNGTVAGAFTYTPYGSLRATSGSATTPLLYAQGYQDSDTGLLYLVHRYYEPGSGQFLTEDPDLDVTQEAYGYASNSPTNNIDPLGLFCLHGHDGSCLTPLGLVKREAQRVWLPILCITGPVAKYAGLACPGPDFLQPKKGALANAVPRAPAPKAPVPIHTAPTPAFSYLNPVVCR